MDINMLFYISVVIAVHISVASTQNLLYYVTEETRVGHVITNLIQDGGISDDVSELRLLSRQSQNAPYFRLVTDTGDLIVAAVLDREEICLKVSVCDIELDLGVLNADHSTELIPFTIRIEDRNDNSPEFEDSTITLDISEASPTNSRWTLPLAYDLDTSPYDVSMYTLYDPSLNFDIDVTYANEMITQVELILMLELDREQHDEYQLSYVASDSSSGDGIEHSATMTININVVDSNDNSPIYDQSELTVNLPEDTPIDDLVATVSANDPDSGANGEIEYTMTRLRDEADEIFHLNATSGEITLHGQLDYETRISYRLTIVARDQGEIPRQNQVIVNVIVEDVNDNHPTLVVPPIDGIEGNEERVIWVDENTDVGSFVTFLTVEDPDTGPAGEAECIMNSIEFNLRSVRPSMYQLMTLTPLDRELTSEYDLAVTCMDHGSPSLTITTTVRLNVRDFNDNAPRFEETIYEIAIPEDMLPGTTVVRINASDVDAGRNQELLYTLITDVATSEIFHIENETGTIILTRNVDFESQQVYEMSMEVQDSGVIPQTARVPVTINIQDVNDNIPVFQDNAYTFNLEENLESGVFIGQLNTTDRDSYPYNDTKVYWKHPNMSDWSSLFDLDPETGIITSGVSFDRERRQQYNLMAMAVNQDRPLLSSICVVAIVITDRNDNTPVFVFPSRINSSVALPNKVPPGYAFTQVEALDPDLGMNAQLEYSLVRGSQEGLFSISPQSGILSVTEGVDVDVDTDYVLSIMASDSGLPPYNTIATLVVKVNMSRHLGSGYWSGNVNETEDQSSPTNRTIIIALCCITVVVAVALLAAILYLRCTNPKPQKQPEPELYDQKRCVVQPDTAIVAPVKSDSSVIYSGYAGYANADDNKRSTEWQQRELHQDQFCGAPGGDGESSSSGCSADSGRGFSDDSEVQHKQLHRYGRQGMPPGGQNGVERASHGTGVHRQPSDQISLTDGGRLSIRHNSDVTDSSCYNDLVTSSTPSTDGQIPKRASSFQGFQDGRDVCDVRDFPGYRPNVRHDPDITSTQVTSSDPNVSNPQSTITMEAPYGHSRTNNDTYSKTPTRPPRRRKDNHLFDEQNQYFSSKEILPVLDTQGGYHQHPRQTQLDSIQEENDYLRLNRMHINDLNNSIV